MQTRYYYQINFYSADLMKLNFDGFTDNRIGIDQHGKSTPAVKAMEAVLINDLHLKINEDYELVKSGYGCDQLASIHIKRPANIIIVLNYLLSIHAKGNSNLCIVPSLMQSIYSKTPMQDCLGEASLKFMNTVASCIESKNLSKADTEKVFPVILANLNEIYNELLKNELVKKLPEKAVATHDLLCHPLFQTLSMLMDDYKNRKTQYNNKGFLNTMGAKDVDETPYTEIYNTYKFLVPNCYCDGTENIIQKTLNADKLRATRNIQPATTLTMGKK